MGMGRIHTALYFRPSRKNQKAHKKEIAKRKNYLELQSKAQPQCYFFPQRYKKIRYLQKKHRIF